MLENRTGARLTTHVTESRPSENARPVPSTQTPARSDTAGPRPPDLLPSIRRLGRWTRISLVVLGLGLVTVLGVASRLEPDPRGFGTHQQLGLAPCIFRLSTGYHCPSCGMTTAFAWFMRGNLGRSWTANPGGFALACGCVIAVPWLTITAARGRPWGTRSVEGPLAIAVVAAAVWTVLAWIFRLLFHWRVMG